MNARSRAAAAALFCAAVFAGPARAAEKPADVGWPREIPHAKGRIVIYQPQLESLEGDLLTSRCAVSFTSKGAKEPVFGAIWVSAKLATDRDARTATLAQVVVTRVRFPESTPAQEKEFGAVVEDAIPKWNLTLNLDRLRAALAAVATEQKSAEALKADPPRIIVEKEPAVLILIDGEPRIKPIEKTPFERVINTPVALVLDPKTKTFYTTDGNFWYKADKAEGPFTSISAPPKEISQLLSSAKEAAKKQASEQKAAGATPEKPPKLVVSTEPAELVSFTSEPQYAPVTGTELLYATNTNQHVFKEIATQKTFILLAGRWFAAPSLDGPWTFVKADALPEQFKKIPEGSPKEEVLSSVAGTQQAEEALVDAQIPQTSAIDKKTAKVSVTYDGKPKFEKIEGTEIESAVNTASQVLKVKGQYYVCDQGVWFVSSTPEGPWIVSDKRPEGIEDIPPSSSAYNTRYVYVYESTPEVVYVGYYPGYVGCYPWGPTVVYGTGWYYPAWYGAYYYPRAVTWGFSFHYNPWYGWSVGFGVSNGFFSIGFAWPIGGYGGYYGGWYGAGGYHDIDIDNDINIDNDFNFGDRGDRVSHHDNNRGRDNMYNRGENANRNRPSTRPSGGSRPSAGQQPAVGGAGGARPSTQPSTGSRPSRGEAPAAKAGTNDVFADRDGNVHRNNGSGWQSRDNGSWKSSGGNSGLNRDYSARSRGSSMSSRAPRGGGGARRR